MCAQAAAAAASAVNRAVCVQCSDSYKTFAVLVAICDVAAARDNHYINNLPAGASHALAVCSWSSDANTRRT